jgi:hypothetical protein
MNATRSYSSYLRLKELLGYFQNAVSGRFAMLAHGQGLQNLSIFLAFPGQDDDGEAHF